MTSTPQRRQAFTNAFKDYPAYLMLFVNEHCQLVDPTGEEAPPVMSHARKTEVGLVCFAQFLTRLIRTRCANSTEDMAGFGFATAQRYNDFKQKLIGKYEIIADEKYQRAIHTIENNIAMTVIHALMTEAKIDMEAKDKGDFVEIDFWHDVMQAFKMTQQAEHPIWGQAIRAVVHFPDFKDALKKEADHAIS